MSRISRENLFNEVAELFAQRATCPRASVGVVAVRDGRVVAGGYNGAPAGMPHCLDVGCEIQRVHTEADSFIDEIDEHCVRSVHAEANMVAWAAREGLSLKGCEIYLTHTPCTTCAALLINAGVRAVHINHQYGHDGGIKLLWATKRIQVFDGN